MAEDLCSTSGMWCAHQILLGSEQNMQDIIDIFIKIRKHAAELDK